ncbi:MAG: hypothetical protein JXR19_04235 [Bacteroidia bacterium]
MQKTLNIYYAKKRVIKRLLIGLFSVAVGIYFLKSGFIEFGKNFENENYIGSMIHGLLVFSPLIWGSVVVLVSLYKLSTRKPQVVIANEGILLSEYQAWGTIQWNEIRLIGTDRRKSMGTNRMEDCIVLHLTEAKSAEVFDKEAQIQASYIDFDRDDLLVLLDEMWRKNQ